VSRPCAGGRGAGRPTPPLHLDGATPANLGMLSGPLKGGPVSWISVRKPCLTNSHLGERERPRPQSVRPAVPLTERSQHFELPGRRIG
jgi:hypothetical protein